MNFSPYWSPMTSSPSSAAVAEFDSVTLVCDFNLAPDEELHSVVWYWKQGAVKKAARLSFSIFSCCVSPILLWLASNNRFP